MFVTFESISDDARIWIYQSNRKLTSEEVQLIHRTGREFLDQWETHGQPLRASMKVLDSYFLVVAVDGYQQLPSGCSIDASVAFIRELCSYLKVDFFDRTQVALWMDEKVMMVPITTLKQNLKDGSINEETLLVDTLVQKKSGLLNWLVPLRNSWLARYLPQTSA